MAKVILIDEIGKMELLSNKFVEAVKRIWESNKIAVGTVPISRVPFVERLVRSSEVFWIKRGEAEKIAKTIVGKIVSYLNI